MRSETNMAGINMADVIETVATVLPGATAQVQGERRFTWEELARRSAGVATTLLEAGVKRQDKVAQYLYNCPEYAESVTAALRASLVPVNTNYRYLDRELLYLWDNADVVAVVFHGTFSARIEGIRSHLPRIHTWLWVDDGSGPCPEWASPYEAATQAAESVALPWERDGDDLILVYTGGTTGMPKGVMWRQDDYFRVYNRELPAGPYRLDRGVAEIAERKAQEGPGPTYLPACPQMHALGLLSSITTLLNGGCVVTLPSPRFDPVEALDTIEREKVVNVALVGDAFARPLLEALDAHPKRWDLASLKMIRSAGVMWSQEVKRGLLRHHPEMVLRDGLGSTEAVRMGKSESTGGETAATALFQPGPFTCVLGEDLKPLEPGSSAIGRIAVAGNLPVGYYKDPEKTAETFLTVDGVRYSVAGDYATVEADGSIRLLGRGSICINTAGEKVFPEEVEEVIKKQPGVRDAACVGVPDERYGERVTAFVEPVSQGALPSEADIIAGVKAELAGYKAPKEVFVLDAIYRHANGKVDYGRLREAARERKS